MLETGNAYVCGSGESGQLGTGICEKEVLSPVRVGEIIDKIKDIACGSCHTLFLTGIIYKLRAL